MSGTEYDANVVAVMKLDDGTVAKSSVLLDAEIPYSFNIDLVGTETTLRVNRIWAKKLLPGHHDADWIRARASNAPLPLSPS